MKILLLKLLCIISILFCFSAVLLSSQIALAQDDVNSTQWEEPRPVFQINNEPYARGLVWSDFLNVAFTGLLWNQAEDSSSPDSINFQKNLEWYSLHRRNPTPPVDSNHKRLDAWAPWLTEFIYRAKGLPKADAINKWTADVTIGMGWPQYSRRTRPDESSIDSKDFDYFGYGSQAKDPGRYYELISKKVNQIAPAVSRATGRKLNLIPPTDKRERTADHAKIRIVPVEAIGPRGWHDIGKNTMSVSDFDRELAGAVFFETSDRIHMEGFLLPNADNSIGMAVCKIMVSAVTPALFEALVQECVIRSMGLPGISSTEDQSSIADWRNTLKTDALHTDVAGGGIKFDPSEFLVSMEELGPRANPHLQKNSILYVPDSVSPYDFAMLKMLYCSEMAPGDDRNKVIDVLTLPNNCLP